VYLCTMEASFSYVAKLSRPLGNCWNVFSAFLPKLKYVNMIWQIVRDASNSKHLERREQNQGILNIFLKTGKC
jgi:hypothetical protein